MAKFNVTQKKRRAKIQEQKREAHGDSVTRKLKQRTSPVAISGKRQRKLLKKLKREQKEALETGLITVEDVGMAAADGKSKRKSTRLPAGATAPVDAMVE